eukprot:6214717-Pleurochrysis_carterae.AAC.1
MRIVYNLSASVHHGRSGVPHATGRACLKDFRLAPLCLLSSLLRGSAQHRGGGGGVGGGCGGCGGGGGGEGGGGG